MYNQDPQQQCLYALILWQAYYFAGQIFNFAKARGTAGDGSMLLGASAMGLWSLFQPMAGAFKTQILPRRNVAIGISFINNHFHL